MAPPGVPAPLRWAGTAIGLFLVWSLAATVLLVWTLGLWEAVGEMPPWAVPFQWFVFALHYRGYYDVPDALRIGAAGASLVTTAVALQRLRREPEPLHGTSSFATPAQARRDGLLFTRSPPGDCIVLGKRPALLGGAYLCLPGSSHVSLSAMTEAGKGVGFVVPNCLNWSGSLIAFDIKGELWRKTAGRRHDMGQEVFRFAPEDEERRTCRYNPYSAVPRDDPAECIDMLHRINHMLVPPNPHSREPYFDNAARDAINGISVLLALTPGKPLHVGAVRAAAVRPDYRKHLRGYIHRARAAGRPLPRSAVDSVLAWLDDPDDRGRNSIQRTIQTHLALWASPKVVAATEASDFDLRALRRRPLSIYLVLPPDEVRRFRPLTALLFQQVIGLNRSEFGSDPAHRHKILMMMDEFWAMGEMKTLADAAAFVRAAGIRMAYVVQTKAQLASIYGQEGSDNLFENTKAEIVFGVKGLKAAKEFSDLAGMDTVRERTRSGPRFVGWAHWHRQTESEAPRRRALLLPQEVQRLPPTKEIIYRPNALPVMADRILYFRDPLFRRMETPPPPIPPLEVVVERDRGAASGAGCPAVPAPHPAGAL